MLVYIRMCQVFFLSPVKLCIGGLLQIAVSFDISEITIFQIINIFYLNECTLFMPQTPRTVSSVHNASNLNFQQNVLFVYLSTVKIMLNYLFRKLNLCFHVTYLFLDLAWSPILSISSHL
jgi:hypothetical protein